MILYSLLYLLINKTGSIAKKTYSSIRLTKIFVAIVSFLMFCLVFAFARIDTNNNMKIEELQQSLIDKDEEMKDLNRRLSIRVVKARSALIKNNSLLHRQNEVIKELGAPDKVIPVPFKFSIKGVPSVNNMDAKFDEKLDAIANIFVSNLPIIGLEDSKSYFKFFKKPYGQASTNYKEIESACAAGFITYNYKKRIKGL